MARDNGYIIGANAYDAPSLAPGLYVVSTPIGNLGDITLRGLQTLAACDTIACEDTRTTSKLLKRYGISSPTIAYHEHNAEAAGPKILNLISNAKAVALVSDAGTPLVSDPGFRLVNLVRDAGCSVFPIPGASAPMAALVASGLPTDRHTFAGFLPTKSTAMANRLEKTLHESGTTLFFESPNRLLQTLATVKKVLGDDRQIAVCRELTKLHEETVRGTASEVEGVFLARQDKGQSIKGEIVLLIGPAGDATAEDPETVLQELLQTMSVSRAAAEAATLTGLPKRDLYQKALTLSKSAGNDEKS